MCSALGTMLYCRGATFSSNAEFSAGKNAASEKDNYVLVLWAAGPFMFNWEQLYTESKMFSVLVT